MPTFSLACYTSRTHRALHSFPTRRSSDLMKILRDLRRGEFDVLVGVNLLREGLDLPEKVYSHQRSEEHTSELQSRVDLVCRLLLEKKTHTKHWGCSVSQTHELSMRSYAAG